jgi:hypothetical protein
VDEAEEGHSTNHIFLGHPASSLLFSFSPSSSLDFLHVSFFFVLHSNEFNCWSFPFSPLSTPPQLIPPSHPFRIILFHLSFGFVPAFPFLSL